MKLKKGKKGWMTIKIDLEKTYDRLSWDFIKDTFQEVGLPSNFIDVFYCVSTSTFKMLWNGEALHQFSPSRGIRQEDPLSLHLFVLCMEILSHIILVMVENNFWKPIKVGKNGPALLHLALDDDLMLFADASLDQVDVISTCLDLFCESSGEKVSKEKTRNLLFS